MKKRGLPSGTLSSLTHAKWEGPQKVSKNSNSMQRCSFIDLVPVVKKPEKVQEIHTKLTGLGPRLAVTLDETFLLSYSFPLRSVVNVNPRVMTFYSRVL